MPLIPLNGTLASVHLITLIARSPKTRPEARMRTMSVFLYRKLRETHTVKIAYSWSSDPLYPHKTKHALIFRMV